MELCERDRLGQIHVGGKQEGVEHVVLDIILDVFIFIIIKINFNVKE
jgi:hypothetical protein